MVRKTCKILLSFSLLLLASGCWDSRSISDKTLVNGISFDLAENKKIEINALILNIIAKGIGIYDFKNENIHTTNDSIFDSGIRLQSFLPGDIATSKTRVFLIGEEFAKLNFQYLLDTFSRRTFSNINVAVAVSNKQPAKNILELQPLQNKPLSFILTDTITAAQNVSVVPKMDLHDIFTYASEDGIDFILPIIDKTPDNHIEVLGAGLFHKGAYTSKFIPYKESPLLMMLMDNYGNTGYFMTKIPKSKFIEEPFNNISYEIIRPKRKFKLTSSSKQIEVNLVLKTKVRINEITSSKMLDENELKKYIQDDLNKRAQKVLDDIQNVNSDVIGLGRYVREHRPKLWRKLDWEKEYSLIKIRSKVIVTILSTGSEGKESQLEE